MTNRPEIMHDDRYQEGFRTGYYAALDILQRCAPGVALRTAPGNIGAMKVLRAAHAVVRDALWGKSHITRRKRAPSGD